ncbi:hypothetical protein ABMA27_012390 [Loxostege sticticalis]|uniref:cholesterol 7-desaturase n=1 Tax=Loxostege sticticalis TaxID=481309 RepID=A0ABR3H146_LOXSC
MADSISHLSPAKCYDAMLNKSDVLLFFANMTLNFVRSVIGFLQENSTIIIASVILVVVLYVCYKCYWNPVFYSKELTDIGFEHIPSGPDRPARITRAQQARKLGHKIPPPYPNGWFAVAESSDLKVGGVLAVDVLGQNLCLFRGEDGVAHCVDAYCPHLGANLAIGGAVQGNCIECPFHKWTFGADGVCKSVPGVEKAPKGVSIKSWHTAEADGAVWIWHDAAGRDPQWGMEYSPGAWGYRGRNEFIVNAHVQEIPENGADVAHLNAVHASSVVTTLAEKYPFLLNIIGCHVWTATWNKGEGHIADLTLTHDYKILKYNLFHIDVTVQQIGPGYVRLMLKTPLGPILVSQSVTPIAPLTQRVVHRVFSPAYNAAWGALVVYNEAYMFERDVAIWNNKIFVGAPAFVKTDKTIKAFRSWFSQFYCENSKSFREAMTNDLDW